MKAQQNVRQISQNHNDSMSSSSVASDSETASSSPCTDRRSSLADSDLNLIHAKASWAKIDTNKKIGTDPFTAKLEPMVDQRKLSKQDVSLAPNLRCLHGIRVITMTWMIVNHTYLFGGFFVLWAHRRLIDIAEWPKSISFQLVLNGWLTVETYFFLSAAIIVLNVMPLMRNRKFSYPAYIFHRLVRLLPAYVGLVALNFLWPLISSGPVWLVKGKSFIQTPCENYLWTNFLFINNWIWPEKQCMVHTWFLSADFQLYLVAPILVYILYRRPAVGHSVNLVVAILASVLSGFVIYANKLMPTTLINKLEFDSIKQQLSYSYFATYQHMGPYCLGILVGYLLHKRPYMKLPRSVTWMLWILLPPLSFTTLLLTYLWNGAYDQPDLINPPPLVSALYVAIHRTIWSSLLAWIVFACSTGRAKLISSFLSHPMFVPLSRLSFSIYLVHLPIIMFRALNLRHTIEWTDTNILWEACGNFIVSVIVGFFLNIAFESPIINLEQVLFGRPGAGTKLTPAPNSQIRHQQPQLPDNRVVEPVETKTNSKESNSSLDSSSPGKATSSSGSFCDSEPPNSGVDMESLETETGHHQMVPVPVHQVDRIKAAADPSMALAELRSTGFRSQARGNFYSTLTHVGSSGQSTTGQQPRRYGTLLRHLDTGRSEATAQRAENWAQHFVPRLAGQVDRTRAKELPARRPTHSGHWRRDSRYNTLTGVSGREWRDLAEERLWRAEPEVTRSELSHNPGPDYQSHLMWATQTAGHHLIPRVDSSTLRRHMKVTGAGLQTQGSTTGRIIEESSTVLDSADTSIEHQT